MSSPAGDTNVYILIGIGYKVNMVSLFVVVGGGIFFLEGWLLLLCLLLFSVEIVSPYATLELTEGWDLKACAITPGNGYVFSKHPTQQVKPAHFIICKLYIRKA